MGQGVRHPASRGDVGLLSANDEIVTGDWTFTGSLTIPEASVTDHVGAIDHDQLLNFEQAEHFTQADISITVSQISDFTSGSGLQNVVEDLTPQLGGDLDGLGVKIENVGALFLQELDSPFGSQTDQGQHWVNKSDSAPYFTDEGGVNSRIPRNAITETITADWTHDANLIFSASKAIRWLDSADAEKTMLTFSDAGADQYFSNVVLLLSLEGADDATTTVDESNSAHAMTFVLNADISTAQANNGSSSLALDGSESYLRAADSDDWSFGSGDFTIDIAVRFTSLPAGASYAIISQYEPASSQRSWALELNGAGDALLFIYSTTGGGGAPFSSRPWTPSANTWYQLRVSRIGTNLYMFVDGVLLGAAHDISTSALFGSTEELFIGARANGGLIDAEWPGWVDDVRITKGVGRSSASFTLPTTSWPTEVSNPAGFAVGHASFVTRMLGSSNRFYDSAEASYVSVAHDATDFNISGVLTTDINITAITAINAGTVKASFADLTLGEGHEFSQVTVGGVAIDPALAVHAEGTTSLAEVFIERHTDTAGFGGHILLARTRGTEAAETVLADGDVIGRLNAIGYDGTDFAQSSEIRFEVDGDPGDGDMPGRLVFLTSADGGETPIEALRLSADQSATFAGAVTAVSYEGIAAANILSRNVAETIGGAWTLPSVTLTGNAVCANFGRHDVDTSGIVIVGGDGAGAANMEIYGGDVGGISGWTVIDTAALHIRDAAGLNETMLVTPATGVIVTGTLTATSYGGITEANLLDKTAAETIAGAWDYTADITLGTNLAQTNQLIKTFSPTHEADNVPAEVTLLLNDGFPSGVRIKNTRSGLFNSQAIHFDVHEGGVATRADTMVVNKTGVVDIAALKVIGNVGFYNTAPVAQQTGVAVTAAGVHAALVNLGLITA